MTDNGDGTYTGTYSVPNATLGSKWTVSVDYVVVDGFWTEYYNNQTLEGAPVLAQFDTDDLDRDYGLGNVTPTADDNASIRFMAKFTPAVGTENIDFWIVRNEGVLIFLDDDLKINLPSTVSTS